MAASLTLPLRSTVTHRSLPAFPNSTSTALLWPASSPSPRLRLLFIPGNPGFAEYYITFLSKIHSLVGPSNIEILAVSHVGHAAGLPGLGEDGERLREEGDKGEVEGRRAGWWQAWRGRLPGLEEQERSKEEVVEWWLKEGEKYADAEGKGPKNLLMGHSIGSWLSLRLLKLHPDSIHRVYLLFPTLLSILSTPNGRRLTPLFHPITTPLLLLLQSLLLLLPLSFLRLLLRTHFSLNRNVLRASHRNASDTEMLNAIDTTAKIVKYGDVAAATIKMGREEMQKVRELDEEVFRIGVEQAAKAPIGSESSEEVNGTVSKGAKGGRGKIVAYFARGEDDHWVPEWQVKRIVTAMKNAKTGGGGALLEGKESEKVEVEGVSPKMVDDRILEEVEGEEKDWFVCKMGMPHAFCLEHSIPMAEICAEWLKKDLKE